MGRSKSWIVQQSVADFKTEGQRVGRESRRRLGTPRRIIRPLSPLKSRQGNMAVTIPTLTGVLSWLQETSGTITVSVEMLDGKTITRRGSIDKVRAALEELDKNVKLGAVKGVRVRRSPGISGGK